jgi:hypothetical protein
MNGSVANWEISPRLGRGIKQSARTSFIPRDTEARSVCGYCELAPSSTRLVDNVVITWSLSHWRVMKCLPHVRRLKGCVRRSLAFTSIPASARSTRKRLTWLSPLAPIKFLMISRLKKSKLIYCYYKYTTDEDN